jgi:hypothetical protein
MCLRGKTSPPSTSLRGLPQPPPLPHSPPIKSRRHDARICQLEALWTNTPVTTAATTVPVVVNAQ